MPVWNQRVEHPHTNDLEAITDHIHTSQRLTQEFEGVDQSPHTHGSMSYVASGHFPNCCGYIWLHTKYVCACNSTQNFAHGSTNVMTLPFRIKITSNPFFCLQYHDRRTHILQYCGNRLDEFCIMHRHTGPASDVVVRCALNTVPDRTKYAFRNVV